MNRFVGPCVAMTMLVAIGCQSSGPSIRPAPEAIAMMDTGSRYSVALDLTRDPVLTAATWNEDVKAAVGPPVGWTAEPLKSSDRHTNQVWISATGDTAYGVSHFGHFLLFLASDDAVLSAVLKGMEETSGATHLWSRERDDRINGVRFVADAGPYCVRGNLVRRGNEGWVVYAGTVRDKPVNADELDLAERARERTEFDKP